VPRLRNAAEVGEKPTAKRALKKERVAVAEVHLGRSKRCAEHSQKRRHPQKLLRATGPWQRARTRGYRPNSQSNPRHLFGFNQGSQNGRFPRRSASKSY